MPPPPDLSLPTVTSASARRQYRVTARASTQDGRSVYRGESESDTGKVRPVAIKEITEQLAADPGLSVRLRDAARGLAAMRLRAIVHVEGVVRIGGVPAVVMRWVEGADLGALLGMLPPTPLAACGVARTLALALESAHNVQPVNGEGGPVVHGLVRVDHIRLTPDGEVKLIGVGLAGAPLGGVGHTELGTALAPVGVAPERIDGVATPAADIYGIGAMLFHCLSGKSLPPLPARQARLRPPAGALAR